MLRTTKRVSLECKSWPLTVQDIIRERVNFEDRLRHRNAPEPDLPELETPEAMRLWSKTALHVFAKQAYRQFHSVIA